MGKRKRITAQQKRIRFLIVAGGICIAGILIICFLVFRPWEEKKKASRRTQRPRMSVELLTPNPYSRPQLALKEVNGIVIHYTANPKSTAKENRNYFEGLKNSQKTYASSHFIIGIDGEIIQCIPLDEIAYASNERNEDTISIECCHKDKSGKFTEKTYRSLLELTVWLCLEYDLDAEDLLRHYDVTGKDCPRYYVSHEGKWEQFKKEVKKRIS